MRPSDQTLLEHISNITFSRLRRELSNPSSQRSHKGSIFSSKTPRPDEEEGAAATDTTLVDLEEYLRNTMRDREQAGDILPKKIGVSFRNLGVYGGAGAGWILLPTFPYEVAKIFGYGIFTRIKMMLGPKPEMMPIIQGFSGVVRPGEMLLVLGKPGSGASTFLRALTNHPRAFTAIPGDVSYAGLPYELAKGKYRGEILYNDEGR